MVTTQEINQAENQLSQVESQARQQAQSKIPRRRFGTRVTSQQQQNILKQRQEAEQTLRQVGEQRQKLQSLRQDISSQEATDNKLSYISKLANSSIPINLLKAQRKDYGLSKNDVANIQEIREGQLNIQKIKDQQAQFNREGIKPITNSQGQIVGFLDENRQQSIPIENITKIASSSSEDYNRYVRAGIIKAEPTIREQIQLQSLTPEERSQVVLSKEVMSYREPSKSIEVKARERLSSLQTGLQQSKSIPSRLIRGVVNAPLGNNRTVGSTATKTIDFFSQVFDFGEAGINLSNKPKSNIQRVLDKDARIVSEIAFYSVTSPVTLPILTLSGLNRIYNSKDPNQFFTGVLEVVPFGVVAGLKGFRSLKGASLTDVQPFSIIESQNRINLNSKQRIIENLELLDINRILKETKYKTQLELKENLKKEFVLTELRKRINNKLSEAPSFKITNLDKKPFVSLNKDNLDYDSLSKASYEINKAINFYKSQRQPLRVLDVRDPKSQVNNKELLRQLDKKLGDIKTVPKEFSVLSVDNVDKLTKKGIKYENKDFPRAFKETQILEKRKELEFKLDELLSFAEKELKKKLDSRIKVTTSDGKDLVYIGSFGVVASEKKLFESLKQVSENVKPKIDFKDYQDQSNSKSILSIKSLDLSKNTQKMQTIQLVKQDSLKMQTIQLVKQDSLKMQKTTKIFKFNYENLLPILKKSVPISSSGYLSANLTDSVLDYSNPNITLNSYKYGSSGRLKYKFDETKIPKLTYTYDSINKYQKKSLRFKDKEKSLNNLTTGYKTYYFTGGKKTYLQGISPREQAILKGQRATLKSLSARFGIEETNKLIKDSNVTATKDYNKFFREYKIMQNKTIKTPNIFIQKRGKRLVSKAERQLIQSARKNKRR